MGIGLEEDVDSNDFRSLSLDSLMALVILGILREQTGLDLSPDFFIEYPSTEAIQHYLDLCGLEHSPNEDFEICSKEQPRIATPCRPLPQAVSILLQGSPKNAAKIAEIRRRQPLGPYNLGGWSAGGVISYEITQQVLSAGERIDTLLLVDSLCPIGLEPLPSHLHHFFTENGLLGGEGQEPPS